MTAIDYARAIHARYVNAARARSKPWTAWEDLPAEKREALIRVAERLQKAWTEAIAAGLVADMEPKS